MQIESLKVFCDLTETESFTKAAQTLHMSRTSVTHLVQQLEARLRLKLLNRTTRRVSLTAEGLRQAKELGFVSRLAARATGRADYEAVLGLRRNQTELLITSDLKGLALNLPPPLGKPAAASLPLRVETQLTRESLAPKSQVLQDQLRVSLGRVLSVAYLRDLSRDEPQVLQGGVAVGLAAAAQVSLPTLALAVCGACIGVLYNVWLKRTALSWLPFALGVSIIPAFAWSTVGREIPAPVLALSLTALPGGAALALQNSLADRALDLQSGMRSAAVRLGELQWWHVIGGSIGACFVATQSIVVPLMGVAVFTVATVGATTAASILVDRSGIGPQGHIHPSSHRIVAGFIAVIAIAVSVSDRFGSATFAF